jgi:large subunit ribosomal protein L32
MVVRMRLNRSKTGRRRSHHALAAKRAATCECGSQRAPHRACPGCGKYNGKVVIDIVARAKRDQRRSKKKDKELRASGQATEKDKETATA